MNLVGKTSEGIYILEAVGGDLGFNLNDCILGNLNHLTVNFSIVNRSRRDAAVEVAISSYEKELLDTRTVSVPGSAEQTFTVALDGRGEFPVHLTFARGPEPD